MKKSHLQMKKPVGMLTIVNWFTDISYIIVWSGTVIVAVTVMFSFNSFVSIFGEEIIQGSPRCIV
jgi:hypothetical protein